MLADLTLGRYIVADSPVHRLDPRVKMLGALALLAAVLSLQSWLAYGLLSALLLVLAAVARLTPSFVVRNILSLKWLMVVVFVMHGVLADGTPVVDWLPWLTREGLTTGGFFAWRVALMVTGASTLTATTSPVDLGDALERLLGPLAWLRVPVHELAMISVIALRFVPTLLEEARRIMKAQLGRGASFDGGLDAMAKSALPILVPLFASAFRKADELALAMDARCYRGAAGRTKFIELRFAGRDALAIVFVAAGLTAAFLLARVEAVLLGGLL
ncbi:energy-coupling factor transporter transmembrane protein EcfT [bacterium]|nr:energy-coupling factor transporter transmembrane protein EcfT [bacterium]